MEPFKFSYENLKVAQKREPTMRFPFLRYLFWIAARLRMV